jgi:hypothetical protein
MSNSLRFGFIAAVVAGLSVGVAAAKPIELEYKIPKKAPVVAPTLPERLAGSPVRLEVTDGREGDPLVVGSSREKGKDLYTWESGKPVVPAIAAFVTTILRGWSVTVDPQAPQTLTVRLEQYWCNEKSETFGSRYQADVKLGVALAAADGATWTREVTETSKRDGVDGRASICNEMLSLALRGAMGQALGSAPADAAAAPPPVEPAVAAPVAVVAAPPVPVDPAVLFEDLKRLQAGDSGEDLLLTYAKQHQASRPLTVDEILAWKGAGLPDAVIKAAMGQ